MIHWKNTIRRYDAGSQILKSTGSCLGDCINGSIKTINYQKITGLVGLLTIIVLMGAIGCRNTSENKVADQMEEVSLQMQSEISELQK